MRSLHSRSSFTLIELLIVIAIIAVLAVIVLLVINPAAILQQNRDSTRLSDMSTLNTAVNLYNEDKGGSLGTASTTYISIPDPSATSTLGDQCQGLGMPALPSGWVYHCAASSTYKHTDGTGWIPLNFGSLSSGDPLGTLPVDPTNQTSTGLYYTYTVQGSNYELTAIMESTKQKAKLETNPTLMDYPGVDAAGNDLALSALYNPSGIAGYWKFDEATGTTAMDSSGNGNIGTATGTPAWVSGQVGDALMFNGSTNAMNIGTLSSISGATGVSISFWAKTTDASARIAPFGGWNNTGNPSLEVNYNRGSSLTDSNRLWFGIRGSVAGGGQIEFYTTNTTNAMNGNWHYVVVTYDLPGAVGQAYLDGASLPITYNNQFAGTSESAFQVPLYIGAEYDYAAGGPNYFFDGTIDDVRLYGRILSPAEVLALYNAER